MNVSITNLPHISSTERVRFQLKSAQGYTSAMTLSDHQGLTVRTFLLCISFSIGTTCYATSTKIWLRATSQSLDQPEHWRLQRCFRRKVGKLYKIVKLLASRSAENRTLAQNDAKSQFMCTLRATAQCANTHQSGKLKYNL